MNNHHKLAMPNDIAMQMQAQAMKQAEVIGMHRGTASMVLSNLVSPLDNPANLKHKANLAFDAATELCKCYWPGFKIQTPTKESKDGTSDITAD